VMAMSSLLLAILAPILILLPIVLLVLAWRRLSRRRHLYRA